MANVGVKLETNPEIIRKLSSAKGGLWTAAHDDGSKNRINEEAIMDAATVGMTAGILTAIFQGIRKAFRNRGKTKEDLAAEKEAKNVNMTCGALEVMLLDYFRTTQEGTLDEETLDDLIGTLNEMQQYAQAGKLKVPGEKELSEICRSIAGYTAALSGREQPQTVKAFCTQDAFGFIRDQLVRQKEWLAKKEAR